MDIFKVVKDGDLEGVQEWVSAGNDINTTNSEGQNLLFCACLYNWLSMIIWLLDNGADINVKVFRLTVVHMVAATGNLEVLRLLAPRFDINIRDADGCTPLWWACFSGRINCAEFLLDSGALVNLADNALATHLYVAAQNGHISVCKTLLQRGADVNVVNVDGVTPLSVAVEQGQEEVVRYLLVNKADVNKCCSKGVSALFRAAQFGHEGVVKHLIEYKADVNKCENDGVSPLFIASQEGYLGVVRYLTENKAEVNECRNDGTSPLYIAAQNGHYEVVQYLLDNNANINKCDQEGLSPIYKAAQNGHHVIVRYLLDNKADINKCCNGGASPLYIAAQNGHYATVEVLLQHKASTALTNQLGATAFIAAVNNNHPDVVMLLQKHLADINAHTKEGKTALHMAILKGNMNMVKLLLSFQPKILNDTYGFSPLFYAQLKEHLDILALLQRYEASPESVSKSLAELPHGSGLVQNKSSGDISKSVAEFLAELVLGSGQLQNKSPGEISKSVAESMAELNLGSGQLPTKSPGEKFEPQNGLEIDIFDAIENGQLDKVKEWMSEGNDINTTGSQGTSLLIHACYFNSISIASWLLNEGADVNLRKNEKHQAAIDVTVNRGSLQALKLLVSHGSQVNVQDICGQTPLWKASYRGSQDQVEFLLDNGALVNLACNRKSAPLHAAAQNGHLSVCTTLLQREANVNVVAKDGATALYKAAQNSFYGVVKYLLENKADVNKCSNAGCSPLFIAAQNGQVAIVEVLLEHKASTELRTDTGATALIIAAGFNHADVVHLLLQHRADINVSTYRRMTPLHIAANEGLFNMVKILLAFQPLILLDRNNKTPLDIAREKDHLKILRELESYKDSLTLAQGAAKSDPERRTKANAMVNRVQSRFCYLVKNLLVTDHLDFLHEKRAISQDDYLAIRSKQSYENQARELLLVLLGKNQPFWVFNFYDSLEKEECTQFILRELESYKDSPKPDPESFLNQGVTKSDPEREAKGEGATSGLGKTISEHDRAMVKVQVYQRAESPDEQIQPQYISNQTKQPANPLGSDRKFTEREAKANDMVKRVRSRFTFLKENLLASDHLDYLYQEEAISTEDYQVIKSKPADIQQAEELLMRLLNKKQPKWVDMFYKSLKLKKDDHSDYLLKTVFE